MCLWMLSNMLTYLLYLVLFVYLLASSLRLNHYCHIHLRFCVDISRSIYLARYLHVIFYLCRCASQCCPHRHLFLFLNYCSWKERCTLSSSVRFTMHAMIRAVISLTAAKKLTYYWSLLGSLLYSAILRCRADSLRSHVILYEWISYYSAFFSSSSF